MGMLKGILVLIIGILLILNQISSIAAMSGMYINWIIAILVLVIGILMLMKKK
jgi:hypothetical protein